MWQLSFQSSCQHQHRGVNWPPSPWGLHNPQAATSKCTGLHGTKYPHWEQWFRLLRCLLIRWKKKSKRDWIIHKCSFTPVLTFIRCLTGIFAALAIQWRYICRQKCIPLMQPERTEKQTEQRGRPTWLPVRVNLHWVYRNRWQTVPNRTWSLSSTLDISGLSMCRTTNTLPKLRRWNSHFWLYA